MAGLELDWRCRLALSKLQEGFVEELSAMPRGVGPNTLETLAARGLAERAMCETQEKDGWRATALGHALQL